MSDILPKEEGDGINAVHAMAIVESIGSALKSTAASQTEAAKVQADANVQIAQLQQQVDRLHTHYGFALRMFGGLSIVGVIIGGFVTGHFELVTHALAGVGGLFAGYGLARVSR